MSDNRLSTKNKNHIPFLQSSVQLLFRLVCQAALNSGSIHTCTWLQIKFWTCFFGTTIKI